MNKALCSTILAGLLAACAADSQPKYQVGSEGSRQGRVAAEQAHAALVSKLAPLPGQDTPPEVISSHFPDYPASWRNAEVTGKVVVRFLIEVDGTVSNPSVVGSPRPQLAALVLHAIMQWKFKPATKNGAPVRVGAQQEFTFKVE